ncbi:hypothetical protein DFJ77DRAFT_507556 [Powellomyces hirtus]|nr:hypothetical protein DFJ77DRAFT_507556 [Powellomyces hirtus]
MTAPDSVKGTFPAWPLNGQLQPPNPTSLTRNATSRPQHQEAKQEPPVLLRQSRRTDRKQNIKSISDANQLRSMLVRAEHTLRDQALLHDLPDKGAKLRQSYEAIKERLQKVLQEGASTDATTATTQQAGMEEQVRKTLSTEDQTMENLQEDFHRISLSSSSDPLSPKRKVIAELVARAPVAEGGAIRGISFQEVLELERNRQEDLEEARINRINVKMETARSQSSNHRRQATGIGENTTSSDGIPHLV